jgi:hypothetical protein
MNTQKHIDMLGLKCKDKVTGLQGVVTSISFDLFGCVQAVINPGITEDNKLAETFWLDICRLAIIDNKRVMEVPDFNQGIIAEGKKGPADKPKSFKF